MLLPCTKCWPDSGMGVLRQAASFSAGMVDLLRGHRGTQVRGQDLVWGLGLGFNPDCAPMTESAAHRAFGHLRDYLSRWRPRPRAPRKWLGAALPAGIAGFVCVAVACSAALVFAVLPDAGTRRWSRTALCLPPPSPIPSIRRWPGFASKSLLLRPVVLLVAGLVIYADLRRAFLEDAFQGSSKPARPHLTCGGLLQKPLPVRTSACGPEIIPRCGSFPAGRWYRWRRVPHHPRLAI
jgi:hypothetical protein